MFMHIKTGEYISLTLTEGDRVGNNPSLRIGIGSFQEDDWGVVI
jgi:hypothetical protein